MSDRAFSQLSCVLFFAGIVCFSVLQFSLSERKSVNDQDLKVRSLTLEDEEGQGSARLQVTEDGPVLWLVGPNGDRVSISALKYKKEHAVWLYRGGQGAAHVALGLDRNGAGVIQFSTASGESRTLPLEELSDLFE